MDASDHHDPLALVEAWLRNRRSLIASHLEEAMSHLSDLIDNGKKLAAERVALISDRDAERTRADNEQDRAERAEAHAANLQARIDADDKTAADAADALAAEIAKEAGLGANDAGSDESKPAEPVVTTAPSGASVAVSSDPNGVTVHTATDGTVTTLDHQTGDATAVNAGGTAVTPAPEAVAEAKDAATAAGATVGG